MSHEEAQQLDEQTDPVLARIEAGEELTCTACGCTDSHACPEGCSWVQTNPPLCSGCAA